MPLIKVSYHEQNCYLKNILLGLYVIHTHIKIGYLRFLKQNLRFTKSRVSFLTKLMVTNNFLHKLSSIYLENRNNIKTARLC